ncbi:MAG TPA: hypothetical protein VFU43_02075 [Streptosporangiaceae bacterium]|nr:hypothetical protein [Streptosporangiaceae bacterium]
MDAAFLAMAVAAGAAVAGRLAGPHDAVPIAFFGFWAAALVWTLGRFPAAGGGNAEDLEIVEDAEDAEDAENVKDVKAVEAVEGHDAAHVAGALVNAVDADDRAPRLVAAPDREPEVRTGI